MEHYILSFSILQPILFYRILPIYFLAWSYILSKSRPSVQTQIFPLFARFFWTFSGIMSHRSLGKRSFLKRKIEIVDFKKNWLSSVSFANCNAQVLCRITMMLAVRLAGRLKKELTSLSLFLSTHPSITTLLFFFFCSSYSLPLTMQLRQRVRLVIKTFPRWFLSTWQIFIKKEAGQRGWELYCNVIKRNKSPVKILFLDEKISFAPSVAFQFSRNLTRFSRSVPSNLIPGIIEYF